MPVNTNNNDYQVVANNEHTLFIEKEMEEEMELEEKSQQPNEEAKEEEKSKVEDEKTEAIEDASKVEVTKNKEKKDISVNILEQFSKIYKNNF